MDFAFCIFQGFFYHSFYDIPIEATIAASKWRDGYAFDVVLSDGLGEFFKAISDVFVFGRLSPVEFCGEVDDDLFFSVAV